ncbi:MAG: hypothetical protein ACK56W_23405 [Pirellula sp.]|jgi:hypothetical protein|nr:hypothetical protein [Pirellula sp.]
MYSQPKYWISCSLITLLLTHASATAKEWTDKSGFLKIQGTILAADDKEVVIKLDKKTKDHELLAVEIEQLSDADQAYLRSKEMAESMKSEGDKHAWELKNGMKVFGKVVRFVRKDVSLQRRRGKLYVNDRPIDNLPEVYQRMIPHIVEHFEKTKFADSRAFDAWVEKQRANVRTFPCEGVMIEFPNGDEYAVPLFFLADSANAILKPSYDQWVAELGYQRQAEQAQEQQRQQELYLQSQAASFQQNQQEMLKIAKLQLVMNSVSAGAVDLWEVMLYPPFGVNAYPISVVVPARNSGDASVIAMQRNPNYRLGPIRKVAGY